MSSIPTIQTRSLEVSEVPSTQDRLPLSRLPLSGLAAPESWLPSSRPALKLPLDALEQLLNGISRRWRRERRRRKVGRAYDMALEVARVLPRHSRLLDVGCGNGFIAHHLAALLQTDVVAIDLSNTTQAAIEYRQFDGRHFPVEARSFDAVLLCYVLHHVQDIGAIISELRRVLRDSGLAIVYEDIPKCWWDRLVCWTHDLKWQRRSGPCNFRAEHEWRQLFSSAGFELISVRELSRWRNLVHPVCRIFYLLQIKRPKDKGQPIP
jgi:ubiquinone/menaquinone biosynthesis C-methylase UbiE